MKKYILVYIGLGIIANLCFAQKHDTQWYLGQAVQSLYYEGFSLDFSSGTLNISTNLPLRPIPMLRGSITMSDANGNFLFYTNGFKVGNAQNQVMQNGDSLHGGEYMDAWVAGGTPYPRDMVCVPRPGHSQKYLIFQSYHLWESEVPIHKLFYHEIDMSKNNGLGEVTAKNKTIIDVGTDTLANMSTTAVKHGNGRDWWIVIPEHTGQQIYTLLVTPDEILGPFIQQIPDVAHRYCWFSVFTPDGTKYIDYIDDAFYDGTITNLPFKYLRVLDFDRCTGTFGTPNIFETRFASPNAATMGGLAVSPNSRFLYHAIFDTLFQFDLWATNISSSRTVVAADDGFLWNLTGQEVGFYIPQLAPDGKIYISPREGVPFMAVIHSPDSQGIACNVEQHVSVPNIIMQGLPHYPNYRLGAKVGSACDTLALSNQLSVSSKQVRVYPNPAQGYVQVELPQGVREATFVLRNALGQVVQQTHLQASMLVRLGNVAKGLYFYEVIFKEGESYGKLQVE